MIKNPSFSLLFMYAKLLQSSLTLWTLWTVAHQASQSMGFSRQECQSGLPCPPAGDLPNTGIEPASLRSSALAGGFFTPSATWEAPSLCYISALFLCSVFTMKKFQCIWLFQEAPGVCSPSFKPNRKTVSFCQSIQVGPRSESHCILWSTRFDWPSTLDIEQGWPQSDHKVYLLFRKNGNRCFTHIKFSNFCQL